MTLQKSWLVLIINKKLNFHRKLNILPHHTEDLKELSRPICMVDFMAPCQTEVNLVCLMQPVLVCQVKTLSDLWDRAISKTLRLVSVNIQLNSKLS